VLLLVPDESDRGAALNPLPDHVYLGIEYVHNSRCQVRLPDALATPAIAAPPSEYGLAAGGAAATPDRWPWIPI